MVRLIKIGSKLFAAILLLLAFAVTGSRILQLAYPDNTLSSIFFRGSYLANDARQRLQSANQSGQLNVSGTDRDLFRAAPLSPFPFMIQMLDADIRGDQQLVQAQAEHIVRLYPRGETARIQLADSAARAGKFESAFTQLDILIDLDSDRADLYLDAMARLAQFPATWTIIEAKLETRPKWGPDLLSRLQETIENKNLFDRLYAHYPELQSQYVESLGRDGDWDSAFVAYVTYLDADQIDEMAVPFDSHFENLPAPRPFTWSINSQHAALDIPRGLHVTFFGRGRPRIADQVLALSPGRYKLESEISGQIHQNGGHLTWQLICENSGELLGKVDISELGAANELFRLEFDVPTTDCPFQLLSLNGISGQFPRTLRADIEYVSITSANDLSGTYRSN